MKFPQISKLINAFDKYPKYLVTRLAKDMVAGLKKKGVCEASYDECITILEKKLQNHQSLKTLINATGVVIHTNLGRSLLHPCLLERARPLLTSYTNLEFDLKTGKRGYRLSEITQNLCQLFGCEDALLVNNNAAAVFLVLNTLAKGREVVTSRGELVEIGGSFRVPEVMAAAGCVLHEVGTTNKTHLKDYENAINPDTALLLKTHKSNFTQNGFVAETSLKDITDLARDKNLLSYYDLGSGHAGLKDKSLKKGEPCVRELVSLCDILSFSGDKLFGCVQAGIILGKKELIKSLKQNQLLRMLRLDKIHIALLNEGIKAYLEKEFHLIPTLNMLNDDKVEEKLDGFCTLLGEVLADETAADFISKRDVAGFRADVRGVKNEKFHDSSLAPNDNEKYLHFNSKKDLLLGDAICEDEKVNLTFYDKTKEILALIQARKMQTFSLVGAGSMPEKRLKSHALAFKGEAKKLLEAFRQKGVIGRVENEEFLLDFRTVGENEFKNLALIIKDLCVKKA